MNFKGLWQIDVPSENYSLFPNTWTVICRKKEVGRGKERQEIGWKIFKI